jgi:hypothetical protein
MNANPPFFCSSFLIKDKKLMSSLKSISDAEELKYLLKSRHGKRYGKARKVHISSQQKASSHDDGDSPPSPAAQHVHSAEEESGPRVNRAPQDLVDGHKNKKGRVVLEAKWIERLEGLVRFRADHPDRWPSTRAQDKDEKALGRWLATQRQGKKQFDLGISGTRLLGITADRIAQLNDRLPDWEGTNERVGRAAVASQIGVLQIHHRDIDSEELAARLLRPLKRKRRSSQEEEVEESSEQPRASMDVDEASISVSGAGGSEETTSLERPGHGEPAPGLAGGSPFPGVPVEMSALLATQSQDPSEGGAWRAVQHPPKDLKERKETWADRYNAAEREMREAGHWPKDGEPLRFKWLGAPVEEVRVARRRGVSNFSMCQSASRCPALYFLFKYLFHLRVDTIRFCIFSRLPSVFSYLIVLPLYSCRICWPNTNGTPTARSSTCVSPPVASKRPGRPSDWKGWHARRHGPNGMMMRSRR